MNAEISLDYRALAGKSVIVTGATGFIGRRLTIALCAVGAQVTVLLRSRHEARFFEKMGAKVVVAPIGENQEFLTALHGGHVLFNFAYDMRASGRENLATFDALLAAVSVSGLRRIVHASSAVVYDDWPNGPISELSPVGMRDANAYRQAKMDMESRLLDSNLEAAILQPTIVYGPGSSLWTDGPIAALRSGGVVLPDPAGTCPAVYVDDVVQAAIRAGGLTGLARERFLINGADLPSWYEFFQGYRDMIGQGEIRLVALQELADRLGPHSEDAGSDAPSLAAQVSARARRVLGRQRFESIVKNAKILRRQQGLAYPDHHALALFAAQPEISIERAEARLGYVPQFSFAQGLHEIVSQSAHK